MMKVFSRECNTMNAAFVHASVNPPLPLSSTTEGSGKTDRYVHLTAQSRFDASGGQTYVLCRKFFILFLGVMLLVPKLIARLCTDTFLPVLLIELSLLRHDSFQNSAYYIGNDLFILIILKGCPVTFTSAKNAFDRSGVQYVFLTLKWNFFEN